MPLAEAFNHLHADIKDLVDPGGRPWQKALGTLGSGNHFIEVGEDGKDTWVVVHSGSRGPGHKIASYYMAKAADSDRPKEGHYGFEAATADGQGYLAAVDWASSFAQINRHMMACRVLAAVYLALGRSDMDYVLLPQDSVVNWTHNHIEVRDGRYIHRKGATASDVGQLGVIPGNREDGSFLVRGKGNPDALWSSSHGAGRVMSRGEAKRTLDPNEERAQLAKAGVVADPERGLLDESKRAYKNIYEVMELQKDMVEVLAHIRPIINIKG